MAGREGTSLGPYHLTRFLGAGGAGEVYLAQGPSASGGAAQVAVKVLRGAAPQPTTQAIAQQAQAISTLRPAHVLPVHVVGEAAGSLFVAMDYAPAGSLATAIQGQSGQSLQMPLGAGTVARLVTQVAQALQPLHEQGIVHGDLKLANLFVRTSPQGKPLAAVSDFGQSPVVAAAVASLAQVVTASQPGLAEALRCVAPEQLTGQPLPASDQYALATIAYYLLTGHYPFEGDAHTLGAAILRAPAAPPTQLDPSLPQAAEGALLRALAKDPGARYPDVAAFAQALGDALASGVLSPNASQQMRYLSGATAADPRTTLANAPAVRRTHAPGASGVRPAGTAAPARSGVRRAPAPADVGPRGMPRSPRQRLVVGLAAVVMVALAFVGFLGLRALAGGSPTLQTPLPRFGGLDYAPTVTPDATLAARTQARAASGIALFKSVSATKPVFSDPLKTNAQHWPIGNTPFTFGPDGKLHGTNPSSVTIAALNQPVSPPVNYLVTVNMTFLKGTPSDVAGLSVRALAGGSSGTSLYLMLIAPEGRYEVWYYDGAHWSSFASGYSNAIKPGLNASNALAVLCSGQQIWFFVNGQYVTNVYDFTPPQTAGALGPAVVYDTTEVAFDTYNVYRVGP